MAPFARATDSTYVRLLRGVGRSATLHVNLWGMIPGTGRAIDLNATAGVSGLRKSVLVL